MLKEYLSTLANAFRSKLGITDKINAQNFSDKVNEVYEKGKYDEWSEFWDSAQSNGTRYVNSYNFYGKFWNDTTFNPKYNLKFGYDDQVRTFESCAITDLRGILERNGVTMTFGGGNFTNTFANSKITRLPKMTLDMKSTYAVFYQCYDLKSIQKIKIPDKNPNYISGTNIFYRCDSMEEIEFEGILYASISFQHSPLNTASIINVIECLSSDVTGQTLTLKKSAVNNMSFPYTSEQSGVTYNSWDELIGTKTNWTISLV